MTPPKYPQSFSPQVTRQYPGRAVRKAPFKRLAGIALLILMTILISMSDYGVGDKVPDRVIWFMAGGIGLGLIWVLREITGLDWLSPPIMYLIIFWMFHFGLVFPAAMVPDLLLSDRPAWAVAWLSYEETRKAVFVSLVFLISFVLGILLIYKKPEHYVLSASQTAPELIQIGWLAIGIGWLMAAYALTRFGASVFFESYSDFYQIHNSFSWPIVIIATGLMLQAAGGRMWRDVLVTALWAYLPLAVPVILAGSRNAAMFSTLALISVLHKRGLLVSKKVLFLSLFILLAMTATIKETRQYGLAEVLNSQNEIGRQDPLSGLAELGGSLRPVFATINYSKSNDFFLGETYLFPLMRQVGRFTGTRVETLTDERFIAERITRLYGAIGYSTVAEAYVNGGTGGVIIFAFVWGIILGTLVQKATSPYGLAVLSVILIPMFINVRNSFIFVPAWIVLGLLLVLMAYLLRKPLGK